MFSGSANKKRPLGRIAGATGAWGCGMPQVLVTAQYQNDLVGFQGQDEARTQQVMRLTPSEAPDATTLPYIGARSLHHGGPMPKMLLAGLVLIGLAACGGGSGGRRARPQGRASVPAASRSTATQPGTAAKRKTAARPDTTGRNPLTNH